MSAIRKLAAEHGLKTADEITGADAPSAGEAWASEAPKVRWTQRRRDLFGWIEPVSISLVATEGPVSLTLWDQWGGVVRRLGHNRAIWPARIVKGSTLRDAATTTWNKFPLAFVGTQARLWCLREADRDRLALSIVDLIQARAERDGGLEAPAHGFADLGAELDIRVFEMEMHDVGTRLGIATWDDDALVRWFDSITTRFDRLVAERPEVRWEERTVMRLVRHDIDAILKGV